MSDAKHLPDYEAIKRLAERLSGNLGYVNRDETPHEAEELAQSLDCIEDSCIDFRKHLAALIASDDTEPIQQALHDLREDLRHILWHIGITPYFDVLGYVEDAE